MSQPIDITDRPGTDYEPPEHVGLYHRTGWNPVNGHLAYQKLGGGERYTLLWDGSYRLMWIQHPLSYGGRYSRPKTETVYPADDPDDGVSVADQRAAARRMVAWMKLHLDDARIYLPNSLNGWEKISDIVAIEYRNPANTALVYYDATADGHYVARVQYDASGYYVSKDESKDNERLGVFETRADAIASMREFMRSNAADEVDR